MFWGPKLVPPQRSLLSLRPGSVLAALPFTGLRLLWWLLETKAVCPGLFAFKIVILNLSWRRGAHQRRKFKGLFVCLFVSSQLSCKIANAG